MKLKEVPKFLWKNRLYLAPGYGTYKEVQKPKEERKIKTTLGWGAYCLWWALRLTYVGIGLDTGDWSPNNFTEYFKGKEKIINLDENKKCGLEKVVKFEDVKLE